MPIETDQLISIQRKREAIEKLMAFAQQLAKIVGSMESVQHMLRPSQIPKKKRFALLHQLIERLKTVETDQLLTRLQTLDKEVEGEMENVLIFAQLSEHNFEEKYMNQSRENIALDHQSMLKKLKDFSRKAQTNVAIRYTLHDRGCSLESAKLPIFQEELGGQIEILKSQEHQCRHKLTHDIANLIADTDLILNTPHFPDDIKEQVASVKISLENNMALIRSGGDISGIPVFIESLEIESTGAIDQAPIGNNPFEKEQPEAKEVQDSQPKREENPIATTKLEELQAEYRQKGFFGKFWMWLNTPFGVTWDDISKPSKDN